MPNKQQKRRDLQTTQVYESCPRRGARFSERVFPAEDSAVSADADDVLGVGADLDARDVTAVPQTHVGYLTFIVFPDLEKRGSQFYSIIALAQQ